MAFVYQILPLAIPLLIIIGVATLLIKIQNRNGTKKQFSRYSYKVLTAAIILSFIGGLPSLGSGIYAMTVSFIISLILWYLILTFCFWVAHKLSKGNQF